MSQALWILRKDTRRFWGLLAVVIPLEALGGWAYSSPSVAQLQLLFGLLLTLVQWFLIVSLIHEEAVPGDRQYWTTRPIAWKFLLLAKAMFILLFIHLPCFLTDAVTLAAHGQSVIHFFPALLACQLFLIAKVVLPAAAIAAVTASLAQFVWHSLGFLIGFYLMIWPIATYASTPADWGGMEWFRSTVLAVLLFVIAFAILLVQYARRDTRASRCILVAAILILALSFWMPGWHAAFALQASIGPHRADASAIRVSFDPARDPHTAPQGGTFWGNQLRQTPSFVPVHVTGIPAGTELYSDRATVTLTTSEGRTWNSGWDLLHKLIRRTDTTSTMLQEEQFLTSGDECWQYINIDASFYAALRAPVRMHITWAMTLFSQPEVTTLGRGLQTVSGGGSCWSNGAVQSICVWPGQGPQVNSVRVRSIPTGVFTDFPLSAWGSSGPVASYGPYPSTVSVWQTAFQGWSTTVQPPTETSLRSRRAVAHFERDLDIRIDDSTWRRFCP
jgi:hypothetical protein